MAKAFEPFHSMKDYQGFSRPGEAFDEKILIMRLLDYLRNNPLLGGRESIACDEPTHGDLLLQGGPGVGPDQVFEINRTGIARVLLGLKARQRRLGLGRQFRPIESFG